MALQSGHAQVTCALLEAEAARWVIGVRNPFLHLAFSQHRRARPRNRFRGGDPGAWFHPRDVAGCGVEELAEMPADLAAEHSERVVRDA